MIIWGIWPVFSAAAWICFQLWLPFTHNSCRSFLSFFSIKYFPNV